MPAVLAMLAYDNHGTLDGVPAGWMMERKFDGWRWQVHVTEDGVKSYSGRNGMLHPGVVPCVERLARILPPGCVLDGELVANDPTVAVSTLLARGGDGLSFYAFDVLALPDPLGGDVLNYTYTDRRTMLEAVGDRGVAIVESVPVDQDVLDGWLAEGGEGAVVKNPDGRYLPGKRRRDVWLKVKPQSTTDGTVTGWVYGTAASNRTKCAALEVQLLETGMTTTCAYAADPADADELIGRRVELKHHGWTSGRKVRHPQFSRTREDLEVS